MNKRSYNYVKLVSSLYTIAVLLFDFFITDEFDIENGFFVFVLFLLVADILKYAFPGVLTNRILYGVINSLLIAFCFFSFYVLSLLQFGYGFTGRTVPLIWFAVLIATLFTFACSSLSFNKL